ncbi:hypothetical protein OSB04_012795 [Centaurea solstitialis]|uniref:Aminotransferase-like plant mobile domain-containing protein n=1 Tax=Centaurea solstitialis TaxID=347529 RepID=A0AA38TPZ1_9ASTR|nr:hypothetical protein OSB04_012795 [Centaurea solstitialis]
MVNMRIHPGPLNNDLLFLETEHRAYTMFHGGGDLEQVLDVRRGDQGLWKSIRQHAIPEPVKIYIRRAGFEGVFNCGFKPLDHALITALVERWRPETHTFHLPIGEVTVTLQDVQLMWGLRIDGEVVTGRERKWSDADKRDTCYRLLGIRPEESDFKTAQLKTKVLRAVLDTEFPDNPTNEQCMQRARTYILLLLGGSIFSDSNDSSVHMNLVASLEDFDRCSGLSWGSAALACLYRNLCKAATNDKIIAGPLMLLQLWAWSRIRATGPKYDGQNLDTPYGVRWNSSLHFGSVPTHSVSGYRTILHAMMDNEIIFLQFVWTPYDQYLHQVSTDWLCNTYIICWEIVEEYLPSRVMRQFHLMQTIPTVQLADNFVPVMANRVERVHRQAHVQRRTHVDEAGPSNRGERTPSHHDDEAGLSNRGERAPSHHGEQTHFYQGEASGSNTQFTQDTFNTGPVVNFDLNLPWDQNETSEVEEPSLAYL